MSTFDLAFLLIRLAAGLTFAAHGAQKVFGWWGGPGLAGWQGAIEHMGFRPARLFTWISALVELIGGLALAVGFLTPLAAACVLAQTVVIIGHAHWPHGFFNSKSGYEFPLQLGAIALAIGLGGAGAFSVDAALGLEISTTIRVVLLALGAAAGVVSLALPRLRAVDPAPAH
ncbi:MAG TPA: DoxX family protein [Candidatus Limnocylindrales bacterium]|jgi:putative oxidoreductase|nr:DoxX family protein [Candidatus Limnocylindrales bacterium]